MNLKTILENNLSGRSYDYFIAGQGLAGTLLAFFLEDAGKSVLIIDSIDPSSSSNIAAGIIHPITGRRLVKSWKADELIPFAEKTYRAIGNKFNRTFYHHKHILEFYTSVKHHNDWISRVEEPGMENYTGKEIFSADIYGIKLPLGGILIKQCGFLVIHELLKIYKQYLLTQDGIIHETLLTEEIEIINNEVTWKNFKAKEIIFCEGAAARANPYFSWLPFIPAKGEIMTINAPGLSEDFILNKGIYILPISNQQFRVGATNEWNELNNLPTAEGQEKMTRLITEMIHVDFTITEHQAAIRPTVKDRRPFLGKHPELNYVNIFNGLGTKGVMLAPFFARQMCDFLVKGKKIDDEVNITRFLDSYF